MNSKPTDPTSPPPPLSEGASTLRTSETPRTTRQTLLGLCAGLASPVFWFFGFAVGSSITEESRFESGGDLVWVALACFFLPAVLGVALIALDVLGVRPRMRSVVQRTIASIVAAALGAAAIGLGISTVVDSANSGDAPIGVAFLFLGGLALIGAAVLLFKKRRAGQSSGKG